jgi:hypothetical protein
MKVGVGYKTRYKAEETYKDGLSIDVWAYLAGMK